MRPAAACSCSALRMLLMCEHVYCGSMKPLAAGVVKAGVRSEWGLHVPTGPACALFA